MMRAPREGEMRGKREKKSKVAVALSVWSGWDGLDQTLAAGIIRVGHVRVDRRRVVVPFQPPRCGGDNGGPTS